ncbi:MAG TPA: hypothetical protein VI094_10315 [Propionibacteriaceae bacterium]
MIERSKIGGTCINVACIPTKTIISSGRVVKSALRATEFGIIGVKKPRISVDLLRHRKDDVVGTMVSGQLVSFTTPAWISLWEKPASWATALWTSH